MSINLTVVIDNEEAVRRFRELQKTAKTATSSVVTDADRMDIAMHRLATTLGQIGVGVSLAGLVKQIAQTRGEFQQLEVAFTTLLQSKEKADTLMSQMVELAAKTPFDLQGVASGARQLLAYGFAAEDVTDVLTRLGNVAAGLGLNLQDLTWLYGTTAVQGRLYTRDVMQFQSRGIDLAGELATQLGKTRAEISQMVTEGKIGFPEVQKAIESMTNEGGKFYNLMQEQSKTITGLISNLGDAVDMMFNDLGKSQEGVITGVLKGTISLVENYQKVLDIVTQLVVAYGTYKTALIVLNTAERLRYQAALAHGVGLTTLQALTEVLTAKTKALNKALLSNPYVLAAAAAAGLAVVIYNLVTAKSAEEGAMENVNKVIDEYNQKLDEQKSKAEQLHSVMQDDVSTAYSKQKAYQELIKIYPELLEKYSEEEIRLMSLIDLTKELNRVNDARKEDNLQKQYDEALEKVKKLDQAITEAGKSGAGQAIQVLVDAYNTAEAELDEYRKQLDEFKKTQKAAEWNNAPAEVKIATLQGNIDELKAQNAEIDSLIEVARNKKKATPYAFTPYNESEEYYQALKQSNLSQIAAKQNEISSLRSGDKETVRNKSYWEAQKKEAEAALEAMDASLKGTAKWNELVAKIAEYDSKIKQYRVSGKTVADAAKAQKKLSEQVLSNDMALEQSRIDIMREGKAKELAEIDMRTQQKLAKIDKERQKLQEAQGKSLTKEQERDFEERRANIQTEGINDRAAVEIKYAEELDSIYKRITDDVLSEEDRRIAGIKDKYDELRKWVDNALKSGNIDLDQAFDLGVKIDRAEIAASLNAIVDEYGTMEDKITKIRAKAARAREEVTKNGRSDLIPRINKRETEEVGKIKADELMKTDDWINLFQNLDALSSREIRRIIDNINEQLRNVDLNPINLKAVTEQLQEASEAAARKNPFSAVVNGFKDYKAAQQKAIALQEKYNETLDEADRKTAGQAAIDAIRERQEAWEGVAEVLSIIEASLNDIASAAASFGADDGTVSAIGNLAGIAGGVGQAVAGFSSGDWIGGITGAFSAIASIGNLFNFDDQLQDEIDRLQRRIDQLQWEVDNADAVRLAKNTESSLRRVKRLYAETTKEVLELHGATNSLDKLIGRHVYSDEIREKTADKLAKEYASIEYSANKALGSARFSEAKEQLHNLAEQQLLIQGQINKEEDKKKTDRGKIENWKRQIEELGNEAVEVINQLVEDIIGGSAAEIASELGNAFFDAFAAGEDAAEAWGDKVDEIVANIVRQMLVSKFLEEPLGDIFDEYKKRWFGDGTFDEKTIMDRIIASMDDFKSDLNDVEDLFGTMIEALPDDILDNLIPESAASQSGTSRGYKVASQEEMAEQNGRLTDIQGKVGIMAVALDFIKTHNIEQTSIQREINERLAIMAIDVAAINGNTAPLLKGIPAMANALIAINKKLDNM